MYLIKCIKSISQQRQLSFSRIFLMSLLVEEEVLEVGVEELEMLLLVLTVSLHYRI